MFKELDSLYKIRQENDMYSDDQENHDSNTTDIDRAVKATTVVQDKKPLPLRLRDYANEIQNRMQETNTDDNGEEVAKLGYIRKALLWAFKQVLKGTAWLIARIGELASWIADMLGTAARPVTATYTGVRDWVKGKPDAETAMQAA